MTEIPKNGKVRNDKVYKQSYKDVMSTKRKSPYKRAMRMPHEKTENMIEAAVRRPGWSEEELEMLRKALEFLRKLQETMLEREAEDTEVVEQRIQIYGVKHSMKCDVRTRRC